MPRYEYFCETCHEEFELVLTVHEHDSEKTKCPKCGGTDVHQLASICSVVTSRKS